MMDLAKKMIKAGLMYADDTPVEQVRGRRGRGHPANAGVARRGLVSAHGYMGGGRAAWLG